MRRLTLLLATSFVAFGFAPKSSGPTNKISPLNQRILTFCRKSIGKQVGDGQCADLAYQAMLSAGAESPDDFKDDPKPGDYVWGQFVYEHRVDGSGHVEKGDRNSVQAGDIIQMRDVIIEHEEETRDYISKETIDADHHTAIVSKVSADGLTYDIIEQNANEEPVVTTGDLHLQDMKKGYILVYHPIVDGTPDGSGDDPGLQGQANTTHHRSHRAIRPRRASTAHRSKSARRMSARPHRTRRTH